MNVNKASFKISAHRNLTKNLLYEYLPGGQKITITTGLGKLLYEFFIEWKSGGVNKHQYASSYSSGIISDNIKSCCFFLNFRGGGLVRFVLFAI